MKTTVSVNAASSANPRSLEDVNRFLAEVEEQLDMIDQMFDRKRQAAKQSASKTVFTIDQDQILKSPEIKDPAALKIQIKDKEELTKNYAVVRELVETLRATEAMQARATALFGDSLEAKKVLDAADATKRRIGQKIQEAGQFILDFATKRAPKAFVKLIEQTNSVLERSIAYKDSKSFMYAFLDANGDLAFANYRQLIGAIDEDGQVFPDLFIICSMQLSTAEYFMEVATEFFLPSDALFVQKFSNAKDFVRQLHTMLVMENFQNHVGALPLPLLIAKKALKPSKFSAEGNIAKITVDDELGTLDFELKANIQDKTAAAEIANSIHRDCYGIADIGDPSKGRIAVKVNQSGGKFHVTVYFTNRKASAENKALPEDLDALRERFKLSDAQVNRILHMVNSSVQNAAYVAPARSVEIVRHIDQAVVDHGPRGFMRPLQEVMLAELGVGPDAMRPVCETALRQARYYTKGLDSYAQDRSKDGRVRGSVREVAGTNEIQLDFVTLMRLASRDRTGWTQQYVTNGLVWRLAPSERDVGLIVQRMLQTAQQNYGPAEHKKLGSNQDTLIWNWVVRPLGSGAKTVLRLEQDKRPGTETPITIRAFESN